MQDVLECCSASSSNTKSIRVTDHVDRPGHHICRSGCRHHKHLLSRGKGKQRAERVWSGVLSSAAMGCCSLLHQRAAEQCAWCRCGSGATKGAVVHHITSHYITAQHSTAQHCHDCTAGSTAGGAVGVYSRGSSGGNSRGTAWCTVGSREQQQAVHATGQQSLHTTGEHRHSHKTSSRYLFQ